MHVTVKTDADGSLLVGGFRITAPAFQNAQQFGRALGRALQDGIRVEDTAHAGTWRTINPPSGRVYTTTCRSCTCTAGQVGTPCKHVAMVCFLAGISDPASTRTAVAA